MAAARKMSGSGLDLKPSLPDSTAAGCRVLDAWPRKAMMSLRVLLLATA